jgi:hypothetical protein
LSFLDFFSDNDTDKAVGNGIPVIVDDIQQLPKLFNAHRAGLSLKAFTSGHSHVRFSLCSRFGSYFPRWGMAHIAAGVPAYILMVSGVRRVNVYMLWRRFGGWIENGGRRGQNVDIRRFVIVPAGGAVETF